MKSIQILIEEHDNILRMLEVAHRAAARIMDGAPAEVSDIRDMVSFIRNYADSIHHGKEEKFLFKEMEKELGTAGENLVRYGMLVEHDMARLYVSDLDAALDAHEILPSTDAKLDIVVALGSYERLLKRHIQKENDVVFPYGEKNLPLHSAQWVEAQVNTFESDAENLKERERQLSKLVSLEKKYCN